MGGTDEPAPVVRGWCPGALRPMLSGDGWVVRIRPPLGRLSQLQAGGVADLAVAHGNGMLDVTNRANLQIRGITEASHTPLIEGLRALELVDADAHIEARRNIIVTPFADARAYNFAAQLTDLLALWDGPEISGKFGFAIDTGTIPVLRDSPADIRLELDAAGGLLLCAEGVEAGQPVAEEQAVAAMTALARDVLSEDLGRRMAVVLANGYTLPNSFVEQRQRGQSFPTLGAVEYGFLVGLAFGQINAETLYDLSKLGALRLTPWRMVLVEGIRDAPEVSGLITDPNDPLLRVVACTGAPACSQALAAVRPLAQTLAPRIPKGTIAHVSGCAKGCAHPRAADLTLVATSEGYNYMRNARANDTPERRHIRPEDVSELI